jgi:hypothetical protein
MVTRGFVQGEQWHWQDLERPLAERHPLAHHLAPYHCHGIPTCRLNDHEESGSEESVGLQKLCLLE